MSASLHVPSYRRHKQSKQGIVTLPDGQGGRKDILLGRYGTKQSRVEYARVVAEWEANGRRLPRSVADPEDDLRIKELIAAFWKHAEHHYRHPDGTPTGELNDYRLSLRPLKEMYGHTLANKFGPLALKAIREKMIEADLCRGVVNQRVGRIRRMFRWAVENELVPPAVLQGLEAVKGLQRGRSAARETEPVKPVPVAFVQAVLPHVLPQVAAMIQLQLCTGMRPGEICIMRTIDIDMTGKVWIYRPGSDQVHGVHKTAYRGHHRVVPIGPRGQEILRPYLKTDLYAYIFSPRDAMTQLRIEQRANRKSKVQPSQVDRRRKHPKKRLRERYHVKAYAKAVARGCEKAFSPPAPLAQREDESVKKWEARLTEEQKEELREWRRQNSWHPHQLRHNKATEIRREAGLDAARVVLGHRSPAITETYAEIDVAKAMEVMAKLG